MKVILLEDIKGVGKKFEEKKVSDGYAANFLIPEKLAVSLAGSSATAVKILKEQSEKTREKERERLAENFSRAAGMKLAIKMKANEQGHLFEKITAHKISEILKSQKELALNPEDIRLDHPIKELGTFEIPIGQTSFTLEVGRA